jgi:hypothetical protein
MGLSAFNTKGYENDQKAVHIKSATKDKTILEFTKSNAKQDLLKEVTPNKN